MIRYFYFLFVLLITKTLFAENSLSVKKPEGFSTYDATLEEAYYTIRPHGVYYDCSMYLTFSAGELQGSVYDDLEINYRFELPEQAIVHEAWLWIGNDIVEADIKNLSQAKSLYDGTVNGKEDPLLLYKNSATDYELKVFPLSSEGTRKVKISYLMPVNWVNQTTFLKLNLEHFQKSFEPLQEMMVLFYLDDPEWGSPFINFDKTISWKNGTNSNGSFVHTSLSFDDALTEVVVGFERQDSGVFLRKHRVDDQVNAGFYQLAVVPNQVITVEPRSIDVLMEIADVDIATWVNYLNQLFDAIDVSLLSTDSIRFMYDNNGLNFINNELMVLSMENKIFLKNSLRQIKSSHKQTFDVLDAYQDLGTKAKSLFVLSNSNFYSGKSETVNNRLLSLFDNQKFTTPSSFYNILNEEESSYWVSGDSYKGNEYAFEQIAIRTNGKSKLNLSNGTNMAYDMINLFADMAQTTSSIDVFSNIPFGAAYRQYYLSANSFSTVRAHLEVGKYTGEGAFNVGISNDHSVPVFFTFDGNEDVLKNDSILVEIYNGLEIIKLEKEIELAGKKYSSDKIFDLQYTSSVQDILTQYTAFIALEPGMQGFDVCKVCVDENTTNIIEQDSFSIKTYPNPFTDLLMIELQTLNINWSKGVLITIVNVLGEKVYEEEFRNQSDFIELNTRFLPKGNYMLILKNDDRKYFQKLIK